MENQMTFKNWQSIPLLLVSGTMIAAEPALPAKVSYSRDIHPVLSEKCFTCHGNDPKSRKADLRVDAAEFVLAKRGEKGDELPVLIPGKPDLSEFFYRVSTEDAEDIMPPQKFKKPLTKGEVALLKLWIEQGAEYESHWAYNRPVRPKEPRVGQWARNPVDRFILSRLDDAGLSPNPPADRNTLVRRISFDMTGLPPAPADVEAFVNDPEPLNKAVSTLIGKYFNSVHFGEHQGRYWLDAARYGDTHGLHLDNYREIWPYRDWVIQAFNNNMPFDQFAIEQLAGDLLPEASLSQKVATGFVRCNVTTSEGGAIDEEYLAVYALDRVATTSKVFLGLAADCASCHDHKFDPITIKDFYSMTAFFRNNTQLAMDGNKKDTPPNLFVPTMADRQRWSELDPAVATVKQRMVARGKDSGDAFLKWQDSFKQSHKKVSPEKLLLQLSLDEGDGRIVKGKNCQEFELQGSVKWVNGYAGKAWEITGDGFADLGNLGDFEHDQAFSYGAWVKTNSKINAAFFGKMDMEGGHRGWDLWSHGGPIAVHIISQWPDYALKVVTKDKVKDNEWTHVFATYDGSGKASGVKIYFNGELKPHSATNDSLTGPVSTKTHLKLGRRSHGQGAIGAAIQDLRVYGRELSADEVSILSGGNGIQAILATSPESRDAKQKQQLLQYYLDNADSAYAELKKELAGLEKEKEEIQKRGGTTLVMQEKEGEPFAHILHRGQYDQPRDKVSAGTPAAFLPMKDSMPKNRLGLAQWLMDPEHPLTARVTVNRLWQQLFGIGIVGTPDDFGNTGELPINQELLDWLAVEFVESGWDMRHMLRLMLTSSTYLQDSASSEKKNRVDPANRLLSRGPRFRLDAEMIRDQALAASGLLERKVGGPSVKPYQPEGIWFAVGYSGSNTVRFKQDNGDKLYRRSLYTFWKRTAPPPTMEIFNAPSRENCTVQRERTNTPLQALVLMNDPQFVEAARHLAANAIKECGDDLAKRADYMAVRVLARKFDDVEQGIVRHSLEAFLNAYKNNPEGAKGVVSVGDSPAQEGIPTEELAAWTMVASQVLNFDEAITKH